MFTSESGHAIPELAILSDLPVCCDYLRNTCYKERCQKRHLDLITSHLQPHLICEYKEHCWYHGLHAQQFSKRHSSVQLDLAASQIRLPFENNAATSEWRYNEVSFFVAHPSKMSRKKRSIFSYQSTGFSGIDIVAFRDEAKDDWFVEALNITLSECIQSLFNAETSVDDNHENPVFTVFLSLNGGDGSKLDNYISTRCTHLFDGAPIIFSPLSLAHSNSHINNSQSLVARGLPPDWPTLHSLNGRLIFVLRHVQKYNPLNPLCFVERTDSSRNNSFLRIDKTTTDRKSVV